MNLLGSLITLAYARETDFRHLLDDKNMVKNQMFSKIQFYSHGVARTILHCSSLSNSQRTNYNTTLPEQAVSPKTFSRQDIH